MSVGLAVRPAVCRNGSHARPPRASIAAAVVIHGRPGGAGLIRSSEDLPMPLFADALVGLIALLHVYILVLEMFLWDTPTGLRAFRMTPEKAAITKVLAANQGLYNGFLAAGLGWGLWLGAEGYAVKLFFLCCVLVAGLYGGLTVGRKILYIQAVPAAAAIALLLLAV
jgi:putative membrane protein